MFLGGLEWIQKVFYMGFPHLAGCHNPANISCFMLTQKCMSEMNNNQTVL